MHIGIISTLSSMDMKDLLSAVQSLFGGSKLLHVHSQVLHEASGFFEKNRTALPYETYQSTSFIELRTIATVDLRRHQPTSKVTMS